MKLLNQLERKYSKYAIPNLIQYIVGGMVLVFIFDYLNGGLIELLGFSPTLIAQGEVWRIVTFIFVPQRGGIFVIFYFLIMIFFGRILEQHWGSFKFNMYYLIGSLGTITASIVLEALTGVPQPLSNFNLYMTLLLAVAQIAPDYEIRIYFVLPVKLKYIGYIYGAILGFQFVFGNLGAKIVLVFTLINFFIFFGADIYKNLRRILNKQQFRQASRPQPKARPSTVRTKPGNGKIIQVAFHCCEVCGKTEVDDPELEFRYCSKCEGRHEYCTEHILNHEHKKM